MKRERHGRQSETAKSEKKRPDTKNREFAVVTYCFLALFLGMMGYYTYFQVRLSEDFINNPYNKRQETFEQKVVRGKIYAANGEVLAETVTDADGNETRNYPYGSLFAHTVGYVGAGKSGIESMENFTLLRSNVTVADKILDDLSAEKAPGDSIVTTLSVPLQEAASRAIGVWRGAIIVMEPATGKILAMVSKPDFDPNTIAEDWDSLLAEDNDKSQLLNRAMQGLYPPGSTFKLVTTLAYINENPDYETYQYNCTGALSIGASVLHCYGGTSHGAEDLRTSFARSCNTSYATLGATLDVGKFRELSESLMFNESLPTDFSCKKSSFALTEADGTYEVMETAIGQGRTLVTPFHMALLTCAIANNGVLMKPYVVDRVQNEDGAIKDRYEPEEYKRLISEADAAVMQDFMHAVVQEGTGRRLKDMPYEAAGKTGSAEYSAGEDATHSWFVGYARADGREDIAVAVLVEKAGSGSEYALPMAQEIFDVWYGQ